MERPYYSHRSPLSRQSSGYNFQITDHDVFGLFEPLTRYARLTTNHLLPFDRRHPIKAKRRLTVLFQETADYSAAEQLLYRDLETQWSYGGINGQAWYKLAGGADEWLHRYGVFDHPLPKWVPATKIGRYDDDHDRFLNLAIASIEIAADRTAGVRFVHHLDILKHASETAKASEDPFAIPIGRLEFRDYPPVSDAVLRPDALFGLEYDNGRSHRFFAVEFDRGTEPEAPTSDLKRSSWLRKSISYHRAYARILAHLGLPQDSLWVLCIIPEKRRVQAKDRLKNIMRKAILDAVGPSWRFCFQTYAPVQNFTRILPPSPDLLVRPWKRAGYPDLLIHQA